jgi:hypothetical protein
MAGALSSTIPNLTTMNLHPIVDKLDKGNHPIWRAQVMATIRGARLEGFLTGKKTKPAEEVEIKDADGNLIKTANSEYEDWIAADQQVLSYLLASVSKDIRMQVASKSSAAEAWSTIEVLFTSQTRARAVNTRLALATTKKGAMKATEYIAKMRALGNEMAVAGRPLEEEELVEYILAGLDEEYDSVVNSVLAKTEPTTVSELVAQIFAFETRVNLRSYDSSGSSVNATSRGRGRAGPSRSGFSRGRGGGRAFNSSTQSGRGSFHNNNPRSNGRSVTNRPQCQVCGKIGHTADRCWHRFDENFTPDQKHVAAAATNSYNVDTNWYMDSGATDHITGELDKLVVRDKYHGAEQVHTANGAGMKISHVGKSIIHTPSRNLELRNVLHVPHATKNLISTHRFSLDNNVFFEIHPWFFLVKDRDTRTTLLKGNCHRGLYPLPSSCHKKLALGVNKPSLARWHDRLGHPAFQVVERVLRDYNLPHQVESNKEYVCGPCQQAKSHQLPYSKSSSVSNQPLELIFSDVWGPAPESVGRYKYYVSFVDDYSKFTWIYLLKFKSEVFKKFQEFQNLVERLFNRKIIAVQSDWGGEYEKLNPFFTKIGISHHVSCPHAHQQNGSAERKHRHIVEVGLSLLARASMPLKFWDEAFLAATYLINRTPSKVLQYSTSLEKLFLVKPKFSSLRIFGCACWPNLRPFNSRKLEFRSKECIFLGYSNMHKGFKCLEENTGRIYISRDVVFDENIFPFSKLHKNAGAKLRSEILLLPPVLLPSHFGGTNMDYVTNLSKNQDTATSCSVQIPAEKRSMQGAPTSNVGNSAAWEHYPPLPIRVPTCSTPPACSTPSAPICAPPDSSPVNVCAPPDSSPVNVLSSAAHRYFLHPRVQRICPALPAQRLIKLDLLRHKGEKLNKQ